MVHIRRVCGHIGFLMVCIAGIVYGMFCTVIIEI